MTKMTLREAIEVAVSATEYVGGFYDDRESDEYKKKFMAECCDALPALRAHLSTFDAERDLLEAAMEVSRIIDKYDPWATVEAKGISISPDSNPFKALRDAYRALVAAKEKP